MATLTGQPVNSTYEALIKFGDNQPVTASLKVLSSGDGENLPIQVSTTEVSFTGELNLTTATITGLSSSDLSDGASLATIVYVDAADTILQTNINNEESARITADTQLQSNIDAEASARASADTALQGQITSNTSAITDLENGVGNVTSFNTLVGDVTISAGTNVTFNTVGQDIQINASGGTGVAGVASLNTLVGDLTIESTDADLLTVNTSGTDTIQLNPILPRTMLEDVKNVSGGALTKGMALHVTGSTGVGEAEVIKADASLGLAAHLILNQDLPNNLDTGKAVAIGFINNVSVPDTTNFQAGTEVYLGNAGAFTHLKPTGSSIVQYLGMVLNASTTSGAGTISGIIQNLGIENQLPNLTQDFVWVGDANGVPQEVSVSSLGGTTINNNANNRVITGSDTANTLEGESKLLFDSTGLKIVSSNNDTAYLQITGGALGAAAPTISAPNFGTVGIDTNIYLTGQNKIAFDSDTLNTYIAADVADPESLEIHADAKVKIWADDGFEVWEPISAPSKMFSVLPDATGTQPRVTIGADANPDYHFQNFGITRLNKLHYADTYASAGRAEGQVIYVGSDATSVGRVHVLTNTGWVLADSSNCTGLLGVALGISSDLGMVIYGTAALPAGTQTLGRELYLNSSGAITSTVPTGSGEIVRKIGYSLGGVAYTFTPSMDYITLV